MRKQIVIKSHELAAMLLALPNLPVYRHLDGDSGGLQPLSHAEKILACDEDEKPTLNCIVVDTASVPGENQRKNSIK